MPHLGPFVSTLVVQLPLDDICPSTVAVLPEELRAVVSYDISIDNKPVDFFSSTI
jgi:hypothetical protein